MDYFEVNRNSWNTRAEIHVRSAFYDVPGFLAGKTSLNAIELSGLGDVAGKDLLHLQCHFGLDTLSWARLGARVTGVDFSEKAIASAREISRQAGLEAEFVCSDVYAFGERNRRGYDIVFTSYGVICWLPDIERWARTIAGSLRPGGVFYMAEFHPVYDLVSGYDYFQADEPSVDEESTYTENHAGRKSTLATWSHSIADVLNALIGAGIEIVQFDEYPYSPYNCFEGMAERPDGNYAILHKNREIPLVFAVKGVKK